MNDNLFYLFMRADHAKSLDELVSLKHDAKVANLNDIELTILLTFITSKSNQILFSNIITTLRSFANPAEDQEIAYIHQSYYEDLERVQQGVIVPIANMMNDGDR